MPYMLRIPMDTRLYMDILQKFSPEIDAYVRKMQYKKESFSIRLYPKPGELIVKKGD